jgi:hypothetical protein
MHVMVYQFITPTNFAPASLPPSEAGRAAVFFGSCTFFLSSTHSPYLSTAPSVLRGENAHELKVRNSLPLEISLDAEFDTSS